jgi:hypothetical protein
MLACKVVSSCSSEVLGEEAEGLQIVFLELVGDHAVEFEWEYGQRRV